MAQNLTNLQRDQINSTVPILHPEGGLGTLLANQLGLSKIAQGSTAFGTTDLTVDITPTTLNGDVLSSVSAVIITPITDNAAYSAAFANGVVTVTRPGGGTSAAEFYFLIIGE